MHQQTHLPGKPGDYKYLCALNSFLVKQKYTFLRCFYLLNITSYRRDSEWLKTRKNFYPLSALDHLRTYKNVMRLALSPGDGGALIY